MRIVLDTNVLVSALITRGGQPDRLLDAVKCGDCTLVTSAYQIEELKEVLGRDRLKSYIRPEEACDLISNLDLIGVVITALPDIALSPDPKDDPILAAGIVGQVDLIVSGDKKDWLSVTSKAFQSSLPEKQLKGYISTRMRCEFGYKRHEVSGECRGVAHWIKAY